MGLGDFCGSTRFSPACAGNTVMSRTSRLILTVQSRVCGEHPMRVFAPVSPAGSAPRVRGTHCFTKRHRVGARFSPACAGNTRPARLARHCRTVQPRVCGEHSRWMLARTWPTGSAPRVRGTLTPACAILSIGRFSPACAGNTPRSGRWRAGISVQPRVCGEHSNGPDFAVPSSGSAPRVREHPRQVLARIEASGSAPRVRGTQHRLPAEMLRYRFSPACAGNTHEQCFSL